MSYYLNIYRYGDGFDTLWLDYCIEDFSAFDLKEPSEHGVGTYGPYESLQAICTWLVDYSPRKHQQFVPDVYSTTVVMELLDAWNRLTGRKAPVHFQLGLVDGADVIHLSLENTGHDFYMLVHRIDLLDIKSRLHEEGWPHA